MLAKKFDFRVVLLWSALLAFLGAQLAVSQFLRPYRPAIAEMPYPPSQVALKAMALGDDQFLFRAESSWLQEIGDGGGRVKPLKDYDYGRVVDWLRAVDGLDRRSDMIFALGSTYFGAILDPIAAPPRLKLLAGYFKEAGLNDLTHRSHWLAWSAIRAQHFIKDPATAHEMGDTLLSLRGNPEAAFWLPLLAAPLYRAAGERETAETLDHDPEMIALRQRALTDLNARLHAMGMEQ